MKRLLLIIPLVAGCQQMVGAERALITQARAGVAQLREITQEKALLVTQFNQEKRRQLDDAFDADVRNCPDLDAQWVIAARQAYAIGIEALAQQKRRSEDATANFNQTADACDQALKKLLWLRELQSNLDLLTTGDQP